MQQQQGQEQIKLSDIFWKKIKLEMRLLYIVNHRPSKLIKLDPLTQEDYAINLQAVQQWSPDNLLLYKQILESGMAQFICNRQYLRSFYKTLSFPHQQIQIIDLESQKLNQLVHLNLCHNLISKIQNLPQGLKELYLDFNVIDCLNIQKQHSLQLLSVSHNVLTDKALKVLPKMLPQLRCLNLSYNQLCNLKETVDLLQKLVFLRILSLNSNPLSMLASYYLYTVKQLQLAYFDGSKYHQPEVVTHTDQSLDPKKVPIENPGVEQKRQDKKTNKKDTKKVVQAQEKAPQPAKVETVKEKQKQLSQEDFQTVKVVVDITNLQQHRGNLYEQSLFPPDTSTQKMQTCFWLRYTLMGETVELKDKAVLFESTTIDGTQSRLNLGCHIQRTFQPTYSNYKLFNQGLKIQVCQREPQMSKDTQSLELLPCIKENQVVQIQTILGGCIIDFRTLHQMKNKLIQKKIRLFSPVVYNSPLFFDPFQDQKKQIDARSAAFQQRLKEQEEEALKRAQEEQALQLQKKGKDNKKAADKKTSKKEGKDKAPGEKPQCERCSFDTSERLYAIIENGKMFKGKQVVCVSVRIL